MLEINQRYCKGKGVSDKIILRKAGIIVSYDEK
jgi:hypothetical protein